MNKLAIVEPVKDSLGLKRARIPWEGGKRVFCKCEPEKMCNVIAHLVTIREAGSLPTVAEQWWWASKYLSCTHALYTDICAYPDACCLRSLCWNRSWLARELCQAGEVIAQSRHAEMLHRSSRVQQTTPQMPQAGPLQKDFSILPSLHICLENQRIKLKPVCCMLLRSVFFSYKGWGPKLTVPVLFPGRSQPSQPPRVVVLSSIMSYSTRHKIAFFFFWVQGLFSLSSLGCLTCYVDSQTCTTRLTPKHLLISVFMEIVLPVRLGTK